MLHLNGENTPDEILECIYNMDCPIHLKDDIFHICYAFFVGYRYIIDLDKWDSVDYELREKLDEGR